ncbi:MAG: diacylglycerol kinase family lipid kinase [Bacillota bacterium]|nr:diacylglycerol kinase family lipid kinase [Bacillota bacterium]
MKNVLLIINPVAGRLKARGALFDIVKTFCEAGYKVTTQTTQRQGHAIELAANAEKEGYDLVCCSGGDGTLHEVINGVIGSGSNIAVGYIPAGTTNDFAEALEISKVPAHAALNIVNGKKVKLDVGAFGDDQYFSYIASFGAFTNIAYEAPQDLKNRLGYLAYMLEGAKDLAEIKSYKISYTVNGQEYSGKYIFGGVSNSTSVAGGIIKLNKKGIVDFQDGKFELMMIKKPNDLLELGEIINGITFQDYRSKMFEFMQVEEVDFKTSKSLMWTLDGERGVSNPEFKIKNLKKVLTIIK